MRTVFDIVLGILFTVVKAFLHALASTAGLLMFSTIVALAAVYAWRRKTRRATLLPADRSNVISIED